jgi:hypothetical protein
MRSRVRLLSALACAVLLVAPQLSAQQVTGRVTTQSGEPLAAVQVFIAGSGIGALTQQNGRYLLLNVPAGTHTLTAERIGFASRTAQITVAAGATVAQDFVLAEQALGLDEIIVTGTAGGTQRRAIGNTVTQVSVSEVTQTVAINSMQGLLSGRTPGLTFARSGGGVGQGSPITIRGLGSFTLWAVIRCSTWTASGSTTAPSPAPRSAKVGRATCSRTSIPRTSRASRSSRGPRRPRFTARKRRPG